MTTLSDLDNYNTNDPFAVESTHEDSIIQAGFVHIRIQQRQGRKKSTLVQGVNPEVDKKRLVKAFKKEFACNGTVSQHKELGEVILLQGDHRNDVVNFLTREKLAKRENVKVHGF